MGSTIIAEQDLHRVAQITEVDDLDNFTCLELDSTITLDFMLFLQDTGLDWLAGEPIICNGDDGMVIGKIKEQGLSYILEHITSIPDIHHSDILQLAKFVQTHGLSDLYEFSTF